MSSVEPTRTTRSRHQEDNCCICLNDLNLPSLDNTITTLPCGHRLHQVCFNLHIGSSYLCPLCRKNLYNGFGRLSNDSTTEEIKEAIIDKIIKPDLKTWEREAKEHLFNGYSPRSHSGSVVKDGIVDLMYKLLDQPQWWRNRLIEGYNSCLIDTKPHRDSMNDFRGYLLDGAQGDCNMYLGVNFIVWILRTMSSIEDGEVFETRTPDNYNYANELSTYINDFYSTVSTERLDPQYRQEFEEFFGPLHPDRIRRHCAWITYVWNNNLKERKVHVLNGAKITLEEIRDSLSRVVTTFNHFHKIYPYFILWLISNDRDKKKVIYDLYQECSDWTGDGDMLGGNCKNTRKSKRKKSKKNKSRKNKSRRYKV